MSLTQLRDLRRGGHRPDSVIVIVGKPPKFFEDGADKVVITRTDADMSPLFGLPVHVIDLKGDATHTRAVMEALERVSVRALGICGPAGSCGVSEDHEHAMNLYRETLCRTA